MHLHIFQHVHWAPLIAAYGYWLIFGIIAAESAGVPVPGEAILVTSAIYAGRTHQLNLAIIIAIAIVAAISGSLVGYWVGRLAGVPLLRRWGAYVGLTEKRLRLGQYVFCMHGGKIVFFGRFVSVLRAFASLLAGANDLGFSRFLIFTVAGSALWAIGFGSASYVFGKAIHRIAGPFGLAMLVVTCVVVIVGWLFLRHHEAELQARADAAANL